MKAHFSGKQQTLGSNTPGFFSSFSLARMLHWPATLCFVLLICKIQVKSHRGFVTQVRFLALSTICVQQVITCPHVKACCLVLWKIPREIMRFFSCLQYQSTVSSLLMVVHSENVCKDEILQLRSTTVRKCRHVFCLRFFTCNICFRIVVLHQLNIVLKCVFHWSPEKQCVVS